MDKMKKKRIFFASIVVLFLGLFLFRGSINQGAINIHAEAPYTVEIFAEGEFSCEQDPCEIKHKSGIVDLLIHKEGYRSFFAEVDVKIWRIAYIAPKLLPLPKLLSASELPKGSPQFKYRLVTDTINGMQKLIRADDENEIAIIYFPKALKSYKILPSENFVLIINNKESYKIDVRAKTRKKITVDLPKIKNAKWSLDGNYLIFNESEDGVVQILDMENSSIKKLDILSNIDQVAWIFDEKLIFVTNQDMRREEVTNGHADAISLVKSEIDKYTFGTYHPNDDVYTKIESFTEIDEIPTELTPTHNGNELYFKSGEKVLKIFLEKF